VSDARYGLTSNLGKVGFDAAVDRVTAALETEGFGVITEIDVKATMKKRINADFRNYKILGACNPPIAHAALQADLMLGLLLPCNVVVFEQDGGDVTVSIADPAEMFKVVDRDEMAPIVEQVRSALLRVQAAI